MVSKMAITTKMIQNQFKRREFMCQVCGRATTLDNTSIEWLEGSEDGSLGNPTEALICCTSKRCLRRDDEFFWMFNNLQNFTIHRIIYMMERGDLQTKKVMRILLLESPDSIEPCYDE